MITTNIVFDHRNRADQNKNGLGLVEIRLTIDRKSYYVSTGIKCTKRQFRNGEVRKPDGSASETDNERINIVRDKVERIVNEMLAGPGIDIVELKKRLTSVAEKDPNRGIAFRLWCEEQIKQLNICAGTLRHYETLMKRLDEYERLSSWESLTVEEVYNWDAWLHKRGISDAAVWNYHKRLKALINRALLFGKIDVNPYDRLRGKFSRGERENLEYLTEDEMKAFCALQVPDGILSRAKDLFIIQMYTGMAYSDTQRFDISEYKLVNGRWTNVGERVKTGVAYISELLPPVVKVLERNNWKVPKLDNADYNHALKILGASAGIKTRLHSHLARHTFATWMLRNGSKIENVSRMLGHTNISQTQRYAKVLAQSVHDDFEKVLSKFETRP